VAGVASFNKANQTKIDLHLHFYKIDENRYVTKTIFSGIVANLFNKIKC